MDVGEYRAWLAKQREFRRMALLSRWTLRALPVALGAVDTERNSDAKLALFCVRASIAMAVSGKFKTRETTDAILGADFDIHEVTRGVRTNAEGVPLGQEIEPVSLEVNPTIGGTHTDTTNVADFTHNALANGDYPLWDSFGGNMASFYPDSMTFAVSEMDKEFSEIFGVGIWAGGTPFVLSLGGWGRFTMHSDQHPEWAFWREWYQGFLDGKPLNWELQKEIAEIPGADWELGPKRIAGLIEGIGKKYPTTPQNRADDKPIEISKIEKSAVAQRVKLNREAIALSVAGLLEQIAQHTEYVRGLNNLEPEYRENLLAFLEKLSGKLGELLSELPDQDEDISDEKAGKLAVWLREYKSLMRRELRTYVTPENVTKASVPSGIILICTGIGAAVGGPAGAGVGGFVGNLIAGKVQPGKAVNDMLDGFEQSDDPS